MRCFPPFPVWRLPKVQPEKGRRAPAWPAAPSLAIPGVIWGYFAVSVRQSWAAGLSAVGPEEGCDCLEALKGFAASPVPTGGDAGGVQDEGLAALVVVRVRVPPGPQGLSLSQGLLSAWGRVRESCRDLSALASPPKGCFPWGRGQGSRSRSCSPPPLPAPLVVTRAWGWLGSPRVSPARIWGSAGLLHLLGAVSRCPLRSLPVPHRHGAVLEKELLMENTTEKVPTKLL